MSNSAHGVTRPVLASLLVAFTIAFSPTERPVAFAAEPAKPPATLEAANGYYQAQDWPRAADAFAAIVKAEPQNGRAWFRLGVCRQKLKAYDQAIAAYRRAESIGHNPVVMYNLACAFSLAGSPDSAFAWLGRMADAGYGQPETLRSDADLASLRDDARFPALVDRLQRIATPCGFSPEARQFDFWVGSWDVRTAQGDLAGTNDIKIGAGGCVLVENWKSAQGGSGQSLNFYDADAKLWRQIWVDAGAQVTRFEGTFTEGQMRFKGERVMNGGSRVPVKMTFTPLPDGRVRQLGESSSDGGKTWAVEYDLYYSPARRDG
ncbi:MAG TPA: tetratricopeptide repeat protein [Candidatus Eisenbacteria bacterium]|nr:tetratricopeptide repeat protein [Candidatus Eisenbacteria bacterium]